MIENAFRNWNLVSEGLNRRLGADGPWLATAIFRSNSSSPYISSSCANQQTPDSLQPLRLTTKFGRGGEKAKRGSTEALWCKPVGEFNNGISCNRTLNLCVIKMSCAAEKHYLVTSSTASIQNSYVCPLQGCPISSVPTKTLQDRHDRVSKVAQQTACQGVHLPTRSRKPCSGLEGDTRPRVSVA
jgi:hypothetical protein